MSNVECQTSNSLVKPPTDPTTNCPNFFPEPIVLKEMLHERDTIQSRPTRKTTNLLRGIDPFTIIETATNSPGPAHLHATASLRDRSRGKLRRSTRRGEPRGLHS